MRKTFFSYYLPSEEDFSNLWRKCVFILDANILLNLYRYPKEARDDLLKIFRQVSDRIWIPYQAALEYQKNRLSVIAEQIKRYDEIKKILTDILTELGSKIDVLQLQKRHSHIKPDNFLKKIEKSFNEFKEELDKLKKEQPDVFLDDRLRTEIDALFEGKIGSPPETQEKLDKIYEEGIKRYEQKRPPGYMDKDKKDTYTHRDLVFKAEYNDLVLWYQIIDQAKAKKEFEYIIFITDDDKEDWWWRVESGGKKTIGPRPELIEEIHSKANVSLFYMYNSERFMEYAREYLDIEIEDLSVDQIADILADLSVEKAREILELIEKEEIEDIKKINRNIDEGEKEKEN